MIERHNTLGGVCLNVGCIPPKALLPRRRKNLMADETSHGVQLPNQPSDLDDASQTQTIEQ